MKRVSTSLTACFVMGLLAQGVAGAQTCRVERASISFTGGEASGFNEFPSLSHDGRYVAFGTWASNVVPGDVNGKIDVVLLDRQQGTLELVSKSTTGLQGDGHSTVPRISANGSVIAFHSTATNLDPRDTDVVGDIYVQDRLTKTTTLVSERLGSGPSVQGCYGVSISADGRYVAFDCIDDNVVPGDTNFSTDVFVRDLVTQTTERVSIGPAGQQSDRQSYSPSISADGRYVTFLGGATNWFPVGPQWPTALYMGVFIRDRVAGTTIPVTTLASGVLAPGTCESPAISADGRYVAFSTNSRFLLPGQLFFADVLRWDRLTGEFINACTSVRGGFSNYPSYFPALSADGRYIAYETYASNLTLQPGFTPMVIWKDLVTGTAVVTNEARNGDPSNNWATDVAISGDGRVVAFVSKATNLVPGASGQWYQVYVRACDVASPSTYCKPAKPPGGCVAAMSFQGTPSATAGSGFDLRCSNLDAQRLGLLFYGTAGPWGTRPRPDGYLCVQPPLWRTPAGPTGGTTGCDGSLSLDFNAWIASGADPSLVAGQPVYVQGWLRNSAGQGQLSDAVAFLIGP